MSDLGTLQRMLSANAHWADDIKRLCPEFFEHSAKGQHPHTLWIGCSDSRVPESVITRSWPGEIFVHRNIANQLRLEDINALSVVEYAVHHLNVQHVMIVGHSKCGGAGASLAAVRSDLYHICGHARTLHEYPEEHPLNRWLAPLTKFVESLVLPENIDAALELVVEENVKWQVENLSQAGWGKKVWIHGWVYELATGRLKDVGVSRPVVAAEQ
ncbi:hypothetical protein APHAL10511_001060 [Amanita phalloides]|nr:hypothetical protein APHAL10511_001060 [Amanita phalloides]